MSIDTAYAPHMRRMCAELPYHSISLHITPFHFIPFHYRKPLSPLRRILYIKPSVLYFLWFFLFASAKRAESTARQNPEQFVRPYEKWLRMTGIMSDGGIDEQALCYAIESAFSEMKSVSFLGFTFSMQDAERLLQRMVE